MRVDSYPVLAREREDRKRRKEHERKSTKRTDEVEQQTENQQEAARTSQKSIYYWPLVLFSQCLEVNPKVVVERHTRLIMLIFHRMMVVNTVVS